MTYHEIDLRCEIERDCFHPMWLGTDQDVRIGGGKQHISRSENADKRRSDAAGNRVQGEFVGSRNMEQMGREGRFQRAFEMLI